MPEQRRGPGDEARGQGEEGRRPQEQGAAGAGRRDAEGPGRPEEAKPQGHRPPAGGNDAVRLRELLLQNPRDVSLRKQYLAARPPDLEEKDRRSVSVVRETTITAVGWASASLILGFFLAVLLEAVLTELFRRPKPVPDNVLLGILALSLVAGGLLGAIYGYLAAVTRKTMWAELGPLPLKAVRLSRAEARRQFLGEE